MGAGDGDGSEGRYGYQGTEKGAGRTQKNPPRICEGREADKKKSARGAGASYTALSVEGGKLLGEFGLLVVGVVLVQDALGCRGIDRGDGDGVEGGSLFFLARVDGGEELLDLRFQSRLDGLVLFCLFFGDEHALFCGFDVGHGEYTP